MKTLTKYILYGYLNMFKITPDFVYPVYFFDGEYYFADGDPYIIRKFYGIKKSYWKNICPLPEWYHQIEKMEGSEQLYIYQFQDGSILMGNGYKLQRYLESEKIDNEILQESLDDFIRLFQNEDGLLAEPKVFYYSTGRRKRSVARVYLSPGGGKITVNNRGFEDYFSMESHRFCVRQPLILTGTECSLDVKVRVRGGGVSGQAGAIRHGISRALTELDIDYRKVLKSAGYLTRDPRMKERKKYGLKGARRAPQFSKR